MLQDEDYDSDTSDEDFVPDGAVSEDEQVSEGDEEEEESEFGDSSSTKKKNKRKQKSKSKKNTASSSVEDEPEEEKKILDDEQTKKKADNLWADFLADVEDKPSPPRAKTKVSSWGALLGGKKAPSSSEKEAKPQVSTVKSNDEKTPVKPSTVKITQVFEFAGEEVRVEKEVDANSSEAKAAEAKAAFSKDEEDTSNKGASTPSGIKRSGVGLSGLVGLLESKKQKLTTLEKTKLDWNNFKSSEGIDEELEKHKKSKDGYLDKQAFLERADLRQFEIERAIRMSKKSNR